MFYAFPVIKTIDDILPAIKDRPEFIVAEKDGFTVVNYVVMMEDTFPPVQTVEDAIRRECRGIKFDHHGDLVARAWHKFFNIGEREETLPNKIDLGMPHLVFDKIDGSLVHPTYIKKIDAFRWTTKMGLSDVALNAEVFVAGKRQYHFLARDCFQQGLTPIFEWVSPQNRIVVDYGKDDLILIAVREMLSGNYLPHRQVENMAALYAVPVVKVFPSINNVTSFIEKVKNETGIEGYVLRFDNGHCLKFKTEQYVLQHKSKDISSSERKIIDAILTEQIDDLKAMLVKEDLERVNKVEKEFWDATKAYVNHLEAIFEDAKNKSDGDRKEFAIRYAQNYSSLEKSAIFSIWSGKEPMQVALDAVKRNIGTDTKYDAFRKEFYTD